jgi:PAS domain S-box-containing protein
MELLTYEVAVVLMLLGAVPSFVNVYIVWDDRYELGVLWFAASMVTGGLWALLYASFTAIPSPAVTLILANFFWPLVPTAALTMFFLAYEFVFKQPIPRSTVVVLFSPIVLLFVLSWTNPHDLVFTADYYVGRDGYLHFPNFDGPLKVLVTQLYGYLLVFLASGMFVGEAMRTDGVRRKRVLYLLFIFSILVLSTMVKVAGLVPVFFDPTSVVYSASGLMFAYSINRHGLFKCNSIGREQTFEEVNDAIVVVDSDDVVIDVNQRGYELFGYDITTERVDRLIPEYDPDEVATGTHSVQFGGDDDEARHFHCKTSPVRYGRESEGKIIVLSDVTELRRKERDLNLLVQIFSRVYRHNMRNDFNVIQGYADMLERDSSGEIARMAGRIDDKADRLLQQATKARQIEGVFTSTDTVSRSLREMVEDVRSSFETRPDVVFTCSVHEVDVDVTPRFDLAIRELVHNAITHHPGGETVEIEIHSERTERHVHLAVTDNGNGIPEYELSVLRAGEETDLRHSSGIGLWLVRALVTRSRGELTVDSTDSGTSIRIKLPRS